MLAQIWHVLPQRCDDTTPPQESRGSAHILQISRKLNTSPTTVLATVLHYSTADMLPPVVPPSSRAWQYYHIVPMHWQGL